MKRLVLTIFASLLTLSIAFGQQNNIKVKAPNLVGLNEQFNLSFEIETDGEKVSDFSWTPSDDFQIVWGPQEGSSSSTTIINGKVTRSSTKTYTYVLIPKSIGHFTLNAASVKVGGKKQVSDQPAIEVVAEQSRNNDSGQREDSANISDEDVFLRLNFSKTKMYVGEPITATLKLYQRVSIAGLERGKFPEFDGFWSSEDAPSEIEFQRENINGTIYQAAVIRTWTLIPQQAGEHTISPSELICVVNVRVPRVSTGSIFDDFFHDDFRTVRKRVSTKPIVLKISPLPGNAPESFGGGVGNYTMDVKITKDTLYAHEAAAILITLKGKGNLSLLEAPKLSFPSDFEIYDPKGKDIPGGKTFEYPFIPRSHGEFDLGRIEYSYFDINSLSYKTLSSDPIKLTVNKNSNTSSSSISEGNIISGVQRKDVRSLSLDIRHIFTSKVNFHPLGVFLVGSTPYLLIVAFLLILSIVLYFTLKAIAKRKSDIVASRNRAAQKMARKRLSQCEQFLNKQLYSAFYEELHRALLGYIGDKLNLDMSDMSKDTISLKLSENGVNEQSRDSYLSLLDECEFARYAPSSNNDAMSTHFQTAIEVISSIESAFRKKVSKINASAASTVLALLICVFGSAQNADNKAEILWQEGIEAYNNGEWNKAIESWTAIEDMSLCDANLYYNIAGAYFRADNNPKAILYYERCLLLDPSNKDAIFNLDIANSLIQDRIEVLPEFFIVTWLKSISYSLSSNAWGVLSLVLLTLFLCSLLLFLFSHRNQKLYFALGIIMALFFIGSLSLSLAQKSNYKKADQAIIMSAVCNVKSSPTQTSAKDLFVLHEGTKVKLLDQIGEWKNIELSDGRQGWVLSTDMEIISPFAR